MSQFRPKFIIKSVVSVALAAQVLTACGAGSSTTGGSNLAGTDNPPLRPGEFRRISNVVSDTSSTLAILAPSVPPELLRQARCIAAIRTVQAGFIFGGTGGDGMATCRLPEGTWSAPTFLSVGGASVGLQIGGGVVESLLLFMNDAGVRSLESSQMTLGAGIGAMVGPLSGGHGTGVSQNANIFAYTRGVGLQARLAVDGTVIAHDVNRNFKVFNRLGVQTAHDILATQGALTPNIASPFIDAVSRVAP